MIKLTETTLNTLEKIQADINSKETLNINTLDASNTVLVNVDIINGFCKTGNLYSPRNEKIIKPAKNINELMKEFPKIFFRDNHPVNAKEFKSYIPHCTDKNESAIVDELQEYVNDKAIIFDKNSTNGFFAKGFKEFFDAHKQIKKIVVVGDCTDICVITFVLSLVTYCNEIGREIEVMVVIDAVETFDLDVTNHDAELMNLFALYNMQMNGVKLIKNIRG